MANKTKAAATDETAESAAKGPNLPAVGGMHPKTLSKYYDDLSNIEQKASQVNGDKSAAWQAFVDAGGDKEAFRLARAIGKIAKDRRRAVIANALEYIHALEIDDECDIQISFNFTDEKVELVKGGGMAPVADAASETAKIWAKQGAAAGSA